MILLLHSMIFDSLNCMKKKKIINKTYIGFFPVDHAIKSRK